MPLEDVIMGRRVTIRHPDLVNIYRCTIGDDCMIAAFVEIGVGVVVGKRCRIQAHCYLPRGVVLDDDVFLGPGVIFTNDKYPPSKGGWQDNKTRVKRHVAVGAGALILPNVIIGEGARIGAGAVVTRDVPPGATWTGIPAQELRRPDGYRLVDGCLLYASGLWSIYGTSLCCFWGRWLCSAYTFKRYTEHWWRSGGSS